MSDSDESDDNVPEDPLLNYVPNIIEPQPNIDQLLNDAPYSPPILNHPDSPNVPQLAEDINMCMVCMVVSRTESEHQFIVMPCGHAWVCSSCVRRLEQPNSVCPVCRARNISFARVYFS